MSRARAYARLFRIPNLPTCIADVVGGFFIASNLDFGLIFEDQCSPLAGLMVLVLASMLLYCGGMADNDVQHVDKDHVLKIDRPIPTGALTYNAASFAAGLCMMLGVALASFAPLVFGVGKGMAMPMLAVAAGIAICSKVYNRLAAGRTVEFTYFPPSKGANIAGVAVLALARVLNLTMGFFLGAITVGEIAWFELGIVASYVFGYFSLVILASLFEDSGAKRRVAMVLGGLYLLVLAWVYVSAPFVVDQSGWVIKYRPHYHDGLSLYLQPSMLAYHGLLAALVGLIGMRVYWAIRKPTPRNMGMIVKWGIAGDCLLMGALISITSMVNAPVGLAVGALVFLCAWLGRFAKAT